MCKIGGDIDQRRELGKGEVVLVLTLFALLRLFQGFVPKVFPELQLFLLLRGLFLTSFWMVKSVSA